MHAVFVEKILRVQPKVKRLYLLVRATDNESATQRFRKEVIEKDIFRVLRNNLGADLESFIFERVTPISGDISDENFGIKDCILREEMSKEIDIVLNSAATTKFDERYDVALGINTYGALHVLNFAKKCIKLKVLLHVSTDCILREEMSKEIDIVLNSAATTKFDERYDVALGINTYGALHVLNFAKKCIKLKVLLHVSTAYVSSEKGGNMLESPLHMEDTPKGTSRLVINAEKEVVEEYLDGLRVQGATNEEITSTMKDLGIKRTMDGVITAYGKGRLKSFLGHPNSILDVIPADMVVNSIIMAMVTHANKSSQIIFHVGSSLRNPMKLTSLSNFTSRFDDSNTEKLRVAIRESDVDVNLFYFDPRCIDWEDYIMNTHIPGLRKYSMKP
nr:putative fatty acyl-coa reductase 4 [Quercus suber]